MDVLCCVVGIMDVLCCVVGMVVLIVVDGLAEFTTVRVMLNIPGNIGSAPLLSISN
jgi:hypothetical protein